MTIQQALTELKELEALLHAYGHAIGCLNYDGETVAPRNSAAGRGETIGCLSGIVHGLVTAPKTGEVIEALLAAGDAVSLTDRRRAEVLKKQRDELVLEQYRGKWKPTRVKRLFSIFRR